MGILWPFLILGIVIGLFGWILYWAGLPVIGAMVGAATGGLAATGLWAAFEISDEISTWVPVIGAGIGVVFGFLLVRLVQQFFFFIIGTFFGASFGWNAITSPPLGDQAWAESVWAGLGAVFFCGLVGGIVFLAARRYVVALVAAVIGSALVVISVPDSNPYFVGVPTFIAFMAIQTGLLRRFLPEEPRRRAAPKKPAPAPAAGPPPPG